MTDWEPRPSTCGACGAPSLVTYRRKGRHVEETNACSACGWKYGGMVHVLGNLVRWRDGRPDLDVYPGESEPAPDTQLQFPADAWEWVGVPEPPPQGIAS